MGIKDAFAPYSIYFFFWVLKYSTYLFSSYPVEASIFTIVKFLGTYSRILFFFINLIHLYFEQNCLFISGDEFAIKGPKFISTI